MQRQIYSIYTYFYDRYVPPAFDTFQGGICWRGEGAGPLQQICYIVGLQKRPWVILFERLIWHKLKL